MSWLRIHNRTLLAVFLCCLLFANRKAEITAGAAELSQEPADLQQRLEKLRAVPYVALSEKAVEENEGGVLLYDPQRACGGFNLYCTRSTGEAFLLDMTGRVVHRWDFFSAESEATYQYVSMLENGDLLVLREFNSLQRIDWDSKPIWSNTLKAHHDVSSQPDGSLLTISREYVEHRQKTVRFDVLMQLSADGEIISGWSTYDHLAELKDFLDTRCFLDTILDEIEAGHSLGSRTGIEAEKGFRAEGGCLDYFHTNTISLLPATARGRKDERFRRGNVLVCLRNVNQIAILEGGTFRPLWAWGAGELQWPHHSTMLESGNILVFDNGVDRKYSRVVEIDPSTGAIVWQYVSDPPEDFYSFSRGSAQRLSNGNTLICESDDGRVFEVTPEGEVVWTWLNPALRNHRRQAIYRMTRLSPDVVAPLLQAWCWWR